ncbi:ATP-binding protein [Candidatus Amarolinea aalborgensis]|jgi:predicted AAA+ superfamily ATPase|uniref:ATP-binding protein n=1 Tax=Candidatus Amarolinea aalborgensis TaxID=2249329 RepID=UPI003BF967C5
MIPRFLEETIIERCTSLHKVILILGARQVGKTTLLHAIESRLARAGRRVRYLNCDVEEERRAIDTTARTLLDRLVAGVDVVLVDEAQRLDNPGLTLKILYDLYPQLVVIATGSSSFDLRNRVTDALTGRYLDFTLFPFSLGEMLTASGVLSDLALRQPSADALLPGLLLYGLYPEIYLAGDPKTRQLLLAKLVESYLFKDILAFQRIRYSQVIVDLARALAYQVGNEVNETELASRLKIDRKTVVSYLDILEKAFVIARLHPFSNNPRREIGKQAKIYFLDLGIRNALINDFNDLAIRADRGRLWENFLVVERLKHFANRGETVRSRFWRAYGGAEVDYLEETADGVHAYEFKVGAGSVRAGGDAFRRAYGVGVQLVNQENYLDFVLGSS